VTETDPNNPPPEDQPPDDPPAWTPPTEDEWKRTQAALARANGEAKNRREELQALRKQGEDADGKAAREAAEAAEKRFKPVAVRSAARAAFLEAGLQGVTPERVAKLVRMLDLDALDIDDAGDVTGLAEQVASVKADYPELFKPVEKRPGRLNTGDRAPSNGQPKRSADLIAAQAFGGSP
jgi:hypothetical protein